MFLLSSCSCLCPFHWSQVLSRNEDVFGAAPTGDIPTKSEWSIFLLPISVRFIWEVWRQRHTKANALCVMCLFSAIGCIQPELPPGTQVRSYSDHVIVSCGSSTITWRLECRGNTWFGSIGNCSSPGTWQNERHHTQCTETESLGRQR